MVFIPVEKLKSGMQLAQDVYIFYGVHIALLRKGQKLTKQFISRLRLFDVAGAYIEDGLTAFAAPGKPVLDAKLQAEALYDVKNIFETAEQEKGQRVLAEQDIKNLNGVVSRLVDNILENDKVLVNISDLKSYDDYTYHHSLSVTVLAVAIGLQLGLPKQQLYKLGLAAVLHDIGKIKVPLQYISKPGRLTPAEFEAVKQHASLGGEYLVAHQLCDDDVFCAVVSHHERFDGSGYPKGLSGDGIPLFGKIIAVADVYDALTSQRPYRSPMQPSEAIEYIMGNCQTHFDYEIVQAFLQKIELYPVGSFVELSNGQKAVVIDNQNALRPVVRLLDEPNDILDLFGEHSLLNVVITRSYQGFPVGG